NIKRIQAILQGVSEEEARRYANNPEEFLNRLYLNKLGNAQPDDGWRYRGRGFIQLTGRYNYRTHGRLIEEPLEDEPDLVMNPSVGARAAFAFFYPSKTNNRLAQYFTDTDTKWQEARRVVAGGMRDAA